MPSPRAGGRCSSLQDKGEKIRVVVVTCGRCNWTRSFPLDEFGNAMEQAAGAKDAHYLRHGLSYWKGE